MSSIKKVILNKNNSDDMQVELPQIRQTLFIVDPTRQYLFDVNQNITIKKLKRMIIAAADLNKVGLRIFHDGVEYTNNDDDALDQLFPDLQKVEFDIRYSYDQVEDLEEIIDLKLKQYCPEHNGKYPYFYCFTCKKSICSDCLRSGAHNDHETKEKYDYLQESRNLVELLFKDLKDIFKNAKGVNDESIEDLKAKVSVQFFPELVRMVKQIEQNMINLIVFFLEKEKGNFKTIENNVNLLKDHCEEGLDKLKKEIVIEDLMIDENVFLTFDSKFKEIGKEKEKFKEDIEKYKQFSKNLNLIQSIIEKTYKEIYNFLLKYLNDAELEDIKSKIDSENINVVDKNKIFEKLLSNIKKKQGSGTKYDSNINTNTYNLRSRKVPPPNTKEFDIDENKNKKVNFLLSSTQKDNKDKNTPSNLFNTTTSLNNADQNVILNKDINPNTNLNCYDSGNKNLAGQNENQNMNDPNYNFIENKKIFLQAGNPSQNLINDNNINKAAETKEINDINEEKMEEEEESSKGPIYHVVCNIVPPKNEVILYNVDLNNIVHKNIEFSKITGLNHFLEESAWVNHNNKLYILGGADDFSKSTQIFLEYDPYKNTLKRLPDSKFTHSRHSLFAYNNQIFVVGGDRLECEKYDIINNEWSTLPNLSFKQIYPVLYVHNNILYSFFGIDENFKKTDNAQKLILKNNRSKWTKLIYKRNDCNLCVYGCGIAKISDDSILFLGGMDETGIRQDAIQFDFSNLNATKTNFIVEEKAYFKDSVLLKLSAKSYGNFSIEETNPFLQIRFNVKVN